LLPKSMPDIPRFSIAGRTTACYEVGGDYLDTIALPDGTHLMVVADVAGKGLASAIVQTSFRSALRSLVSQPLPLAEIVARVGQQHWGEGDEARRRYVTAIFMKLDIARGEIEMVNAGHNPGALVLPDGSVRMIDASGTPLGMLSGMSYSSETFPFAPGSRILLYTDGLTEVFCGEDEFGCERLAEEFRTIATPCAEDILDSLWYKLAAFSSDTHQTDDMTALAVCHLSQSQQESAKQETAQQEILQL
jgi:sigma-B regulation protein RsbU (phosphoserine phosphatase)